MEDGFTKPWEDVVEFFRVDPDVGLSQAQVASNQEKYGPNGESSAVGPSTAPCRRREGISGTAGRVPPRERDLERVGWPARPASVQLRRGAYV